MRRLALLLGACSGAASTAPDASPAPDAATGTGHVVYTLGGDAYEIAAAPNATPQDLGSADWVNVSPDGAHLIFSTTRFGCDTWACVVVDQTPYPNLHVERAAISPDGNTIVYPSTDTTINGHSEDLVAMTGGTTTILTGASTHPYHHLPAFSNDGTKLLFDCSADPYSTGSTSICEVGVDGSGFREVVTPADASGTGLALHHPDYAPDGSVVFEGDWAGEQIWSRTGTDTPIDRSGNDHDDNSPCVLPDGRIVSLWLDRAGGPSTHELKIMDASGADPMMLLENVDVTDGGIGCAP